MKFKSDAEEILDDIWEILDTHAHGEYLGDMIYEYIQQKRLEFVEPQGDCCG